MIPKPLGERLAAVLLMAALLVLLAGVAVEIWDPYGQIAAVLLGCVFVVALLTSD